MDLLVQATRRICLNFNYAFVGAGPKKDKLKFNYGFVGAGHKKDKFKFQ
jgi:hypothetical protein